MNTPYKKGIGSYDKKEEGKRGFKMPGSTMAYYKEAFNQSEANMLRPETSVPVSNNMQEKINKKVDEKVEQKVDQVVNNKTNEGLV